MINFGNTFPITLIRHGESECNRLHTVPSEERMDLEEDFYNTECKSPLYGGNPPLTDKGKDQALLLGEKLVPIFEENIETLSSGNSTPRIKIFSSDLERASQTAAISLKKVCDVLNLNFEEMISGIEYRSQLRATVKYGIGRFSGPDFESLIEEVGQEIYISSRRHFRHIIVFCHIETIQDLITHFSNLYKILKTTEIKMIVDNCGFVTFSLTWGNLTFESLEKSTVQLGTMEIKRFKPFFGIF